MVTDESFYRALNFHSRAETEPVLDFGPIQSKRSEFKLRLECPSTAQAREGFRLVRCDRAGIH
jgi:hypothetical protein